MTGRIASSAAMSGSMIVGMSGSSDCMIRPTTGTSVPNASVMTGMICLTVALKVSDSLSNTGFMDRSSALNRSNKALA